MNYYIGIDIGTTSSKAVAFSEKGEVIVSHSFAYQMHHPDTNWSEQNPDEIFLAVINGLNKIIESCGPQPPLFVSFSAAMHSLIIVDDKGNPITQCIIWADNRADPVAEKLKNSEEGYTFYLSSGVPIHSMSPLCKILWFKQYQPEIFKLGFKFIGIKEFVFSRLVETFVVDTSIASATGLLNIKALEWDEEILDFLGINPSRLSKVVSTKQVFYYEGICHQLLLPKGIPFIIGASDGALSNLGTGAINTNTLAVTVGTSGAVRMVVSAPVTDKQMRTFCYHLKDGLYIAGGANNNGAVVLQWLKEKLLQTEDDYEQLFEQAKTIAAGSEDLLFLPYILGERAPMWNANAKGVYFGLTIQHTKAHLIRATVEGVIFSLYSIGKILTEQKEITELYASGGFAKSPMWLQILADVFKVKVLVSAALESAALGAVMLGAEALGSQTRFHPKILATYTPNPEEHQRYKTAFQRFERIYDLVKGEMVSKQSMA